MSKLENALRRVFGREGKDAEPTEEPEQSSTEVNRFLKAKGCQHLDQIQEVSPGTQGCEECLQTGDTWVHLRMCMTCGHVGCCDNSRGKHATKHFHLTGHPIVRSFEPGETWMWCYEDAKLML